MTIRNIWNRKYRPGKKWLKMFRVSLWRKNRLLMHIHAVIWGWAL